MGGHPRELAASRVGGIGQRKRFAIGFGVDGRHERHFAARGRGQIVVGPFRDQKPGVVAEAAFEPRDARLHQFLLLVGREVAGRLDRLHEPLRFGYVEADPAIGMKVSLQLAVARQVLGEEMQPVGDARRQAEGPAERGTEPVVIGAVAAFRFEGVVVLATSDVAE